MTRIIRTLDEIAPGYRVLYCDLWGCLHDGTRAYPAAVAALERFKARGGAVALLTNSPRPSPGVARQLESLGAPRSCYDVIVSSGDAAQAAMGAGLFGKRVFHIGPARDESFFVDPDGQPYAIERVPLTEAEGIVCTGLFDDATETPEDYRAILLEARLRGLRMLCANPDIVVDVGDTRIYCAGALGAAYAADGGEVFYFGKPHPPIYALARDRVTGLSARRLPATTSCASATGSRPTCRAPWARASTRSSSPAVSRRRKPEQGRAAIPIRRGSPPFSRRPASPR
jgi:HAD superfamily hydrolase (TIGR01459 family)